jgi:hypothetical protein
LDEFPVHSNFGGTLHLGSPVCQQVMFWGYSSGTAQHPDIAVCVISPAVSHHLKMTLLSPDLKMQLLENCVMVMVALPSLK